jgi:putative resolvase
LLNVTVNTLQSWDREKKLKAFRNPISNRRYYTQEQIDSFLGKRIIEKEVILYARVSNSGQKDDLNNQKQYLYDYCLEHKYRNFELLSDIGSGLNYKRKNWNLILQKVSQQKVSTIVVAHKDRFIRFGFDWFESFCKDNGCTIEVINSDICSPEEELVKDLISIIHVFSCRIYGLRKYKTKVKKDEELLHRN